MDPKNPEVQAMMAAFMENAKKMQENLRQAYQKVAEKNKGRTVIGKAGGDLVVAHVNLQMQVVRIDLKPELFEKHESIVIGELITSAVNQGMVEAQEAVKKDMMEVTKEMGLPPSFPSSIGN